MEKLYLSSTQSPTISSPFLNPFSPVSRARKRINFPLNCPKKFILFASKDDPDSVKDSNSSSNDKLNQWDLMELKFGKMIGEDPKLTLAKVMGRKINPDASFLEIEKNFHRNKGKMVEVKEVPFDVPEKLGSKKMANGLNLVKPVPKKGIEVGRGENSSKLPEIKRPSGAIKNKSTVAKSSAPNVILRKPSIFTEDDDKDSSSRMRIKPNLSLSMRTEPVKEQFSGMTLLKRPQPSLVQEESVGESENSLPSGSVYDGHTNKPDNEFEGREEEDITIASPTEVPLLEKPKAIQSQNTKEDATISSFTGMAGVVEDIVERFTESVRDLDVKEEQLEEVSQSGTQHLEQNDAGYSEKVNGTGDPTSVKAPASDLAIESVLLGRPKRLELPRKEMSSPVQVGTVPAYPEGFDGGGGQGNRNVSRSVGESEETDWARVEQQFKLGDRVEVELISCSPRGFVASFGSLIGFLPYRNLAAKWKFLAFESWLRKNDLDPSKYRMNLGVIGSDEGSNMSISRESSAPSEVAQKAELKVTADMDLQDLLKIYDQEKIKYLSSYIGQRIKVNILLADKNARKLIFSMRPKEKDEIIEQKRSLMAKLNVGDVVKCCIKKITYFGVFVEIEGVPALVHQTEVSWNGTLDPASYPKIGQIVEAKVHQLDYALERIFLSLKEITPDPLNEALECIVGNNSCNDGLEATQADSEWPDVDSLIKELQEIDGVQTVNKGRFFLSPGLAPTFQVYMASMFENQYKLLARSGNKVQEVFVEASLDKEEMKNAILKGTNGVEL